MVARAWDSETGRGFSTRVLGIAAFLFYGKEGKLVILYNKFLI